MSKKEKITDEMVLKAVYSYVFNTIKPSKVIPLDNLSSLNIEDLDCVDESMFEEIKYSEEEVKFMLKKLSKIIKELEKKEKL